MSISSLIESGPCNGPGTQHNGVNETARQNAGMTTEAQRSTSTVPKNQDGSTSGGPPRATASLARWRSYIASYVLNHRTEMEEDVEKVMRKPYLAR